MIKPLISKSDARKKILSKIEISESGCWIWGGSCFPYGTIHFRGKTRRTHVVSLFVFKNIGMERTRGLIVTDHLCRNKSCVNPDHLEIVSGKINILRGVGFSAKNAVKSHCPSGHAYSTENVYFSKKNQRHCRTCHREKAIIYRERNREKIRESDRIRRMERKSATNQRIKFS